MISHGQRGRMDDQCCSLDPSRSAPCTPRHTDRKVAAGTLKAIFIFCIFLLLCYFLSSLSLQCLYNFIGFHVSSSQVQMLKCCSTSWPTLRADDWTTREFLFRHYQDYRKGVAHLLEREIQMSCVTWSLKSRFVPFSFQRVVIKTLLQQESLSHIGESQTINFLGLPNGRPEVLTSSNPNSRESVTEERKVWFRASTLSLLHPKFRHRTTKE